MKNWYVTKTQCGVSTRRSQMRGDVAEMTFNKSEETMAARAVLCAAAPELLEACKAFLNTFETNECYPRFHGAIDAARIAITKAEKGV